MDNIVIFCIGAAVLAAAASYFITKSKFVARQVRLGAELDHARQRAEELAAELEKVRTEGQRLVKEQKEEGIMALDKAKAEWESNQGKMMAEMQKRFDETVEKMQAQLKNATESMLKERQEEFSKSSSENIGQYVKSMKEEMERIKKAMEEGEKNQAERSGSMDKLIQNMMEHSVAARKSTDELTAAFRHGNKFQGNWGEAVLSELLKSQGLTEGVHFHAQTDLKDAGGKAVKSEDGKALMPDVILHLDDRREVIIDSKVSLTSYMEYVNAESEEARKAALKAHVASIQKHVSELSKKDYSFYVKPPKVSANYVMMFVPNSGALWTALNAEPKLWREAADANVYICDEQSLYGALKIVNMTWTQISQAQNHREVFKLADEMIERIGKLKASYNSMGDALQKAVKAHEEGEKKLEDKGQSIIGTAEKLLKLGARAKRSNPILPMLDIDDIPSVTEEES